MTFVEKHRFGAGRGEKAWLKMSWEGEIFGMGMMEATAEMYPEHADEATASATMEWFNIHVLEDFGHQAGVHISLKDGLSRQVSLTTRTRCGTGSSPR